MIKTQIPSSPLSPRISRPLRSLTALAVCFALVLGAGRAQADPKIDPALKRAATFLVSQQKPKGNFGEQFPMAMTSIAVLGLAAGGHQPTDPTPEGQAMRKGLDYILLPENQTKEGYFGKVDNSRMYGHGMTTLMLSEMLGMGVDDKQDAIIREKCKLGIQLILRAQSMRKPEIHAGGWLYEPDSAGSDLSVTCWQTMALRAAQNAGMEVPQEAVEKAVGFMKRMYQTVPGQQGPNAAGGFGYSAPGTETSTTAEGLLAMQVCGQYEAKEVIAAGNHLLNQDLNKVAPWFYYTAYYYAQGMYQRGGKYAETSKRVIPEVILPRQEPDGSFKGDEGGAGKVYCTSMAMLALAVKNHFLPIYQR